MNLLSEADIASLLAEEPITDEWPWNATDGIAVHNHIKSVVAEIRRKNRLLDKTEFGHYGSGYASYVDCWLYREDAEFRFAKGNCYWGLVVLFSTLSHYYAIAEGQKTWEATTASSYLPSFEHIDRITHPATQALVDSVCAILDSRGWVRARASDLAELLPGPRTTGVPTILSHPPYRHFDALFYWMD